jgi:hypothetical protein
MSLRFELQNFQSKKTGESNIRLVIQKGSKRKRIATDLKTPKLGWCGFV